MFVNPGIVFVRNKCNRDELIYDQSQHIFNKSLKKRSLKWAKLQKSKSMAAGSMLSKSDDDTLGTLDETKSDDDGPMGTKSDPEDCVTVDFKKSFMNAVQEKARIIKEKEIAKHVEDFKEEMRLNHHNTRNFGPYDEHHEKNWHQRSPSKSSSGTTSTRSSASSRSSPIKSPTDNSHSNHASGAPQEVSASPRQTHSNPPSASSPAASGTEQQQQHHHRTASKTPNGQILNMLNQLNLEKLQNGLNHNNHHHLTHHHNHFQHTNPHTNGLSTVHFAANKEFAIDCTQSNYGKHLKEILNACRLHTQRLNHSNHSKNGYKNGMSPTNRTTTKSRGVDISDNNNALHPQDGEEFSVSMHGDYPLLFPTSFASPSPTVSPTVSPFNSFLSLHAEIDNEPTAIRLTQSEPFSAMIPTVNGSTTKIHSMSPTNLYTHFAPFFLFFREETND